MNDHTSFERYVIEAFDREGPGRPVPDAIHDELITRAGRQRQWPTWLASVKEPPMRLTNSNAVGSPTIRVLATMAATLLLILAMALVGVAGKNLLAADGTIVVDPEGNGDFTTITEAVDAAEDGDTILVRDGIYAEAVIITRNITLMGESRDDVILEVGVGCTVQGEDAEQEAVCPPEVPQLDGTTTAPGGPYGFHLDGTTAKISDLTFRHVANGNGLYVSGGAPTVRNVVYADNTYDRPNGGMGNLMLRLGTAAQVLDTDIGQGWMMIEERSPVVVERSNAGAYLAHVPRAKSVGGPAVFKDNTTDGMFWINGMAEVVGNEVVQIEGVDSAGIYIEDGDGWIVRENVIHGSPSPRGAIEIDAFAGPGEVLDNTLEGNAVGIGISNGSLVAGNSVRDGTTGIWIRSGSPEVRDNDVEGMERLGIHVLVADPVLSGNRACGNPTDLMIAAGSDAVVDATNEFCIVDDQRRTE